MASSADQLQSLQFYCCLVWIASNSLRHLFYVQALLDKSFLVQKNVSFLTLLLLFNGISSIVTLATLASKKVVTLNDVTLIQLKVIQMVLRLTLKIVFLIRVFSFVGFKLIRFSLFWPFRFLRTKTFSILINQSSLQLSEGLCAAAFHRRRRPHLQPHPT